MGALEDAKSIARDCANDTHVRVKLSLLQDLIVELERSRKERPLSALRNKMETEQEAK